MMHTLRFSSTRRLGTALVVATTFLLATTIWSACTPPVQSQSPEDAVRHVLDQIHEQASRADFDAYFALYTDDAVFLGTDASERWPIADFKEYTRARFATGTGWTYEMKERHVVVKGDVAWFDERLYNENLGNTRGSGVLLLTESGWKVAQYNLTMLIPNEVAREVAKMHD